MKVESKLIEIPNNKKPDADYIEQELIKRNINPLRWAVVDVSDTMYSVSVADLIK